MKDKKSILIGILIVVIVILLGAYFSYKIYLINHYSDKLLDYSFEEISSVFKMKDNIEINSQVINASDYLEFKEIKIRNDFKNYQREEKSDVTGNYLVLKDSETGNYISLGIGENYMDYLHLKNDDSEDVIVSNVLRKDVVNYLKKNNITNDEELFNFIGSDNYNKNIFTSASDIKGNLGTYFIASVIKPNKIIKLDGDLKGYIFEVSDNLREINILKNNKRYIIVMGGSYFTIDKVKDLLTTLVIE